MCNFYKSAKKITSLARETTRACIVLEIMMLCTGICLSAVLVQSVRGAWLENRGTAWLCRRCRVLVWDSGSTARRYSLITFCIMSFLYPVNVNLTVGEITS